MDDASGRSGNGDVLSGLRRRPDLVARQVGLDSALYDPAADSVHMLNPVATAVWYHLTPDRSFKNVAEALQLTFGTDHAEEIARDLEAFVQRLRELNVLIREDEEPPMRPGGEREQFPLPDPEITPYPSGYTAPAVKSFTVAQLQEMYDVGGGKMPLFSDFIPEAE